MKHSLIIGGTRGTGRVLARHFAAAGHTVSVIGRRKPLDEDPPGARFWAAEITDPDDRARAIGEILSENGKLSRLVFFQRFRGTGDGWAGEIATSLTATKEIIESLAVEFEEGGEKSIVVVGSIACSLIADEQPVGYHVAKAGLLQMARYYAATLGPRGIRVNCVSPGTVMKEEAREFYEGNRELQRMYRTVIPLGRMGTSDEIANVIEFLGSSKASFITGQELVVDGGLSVQWQETVGRRMLGEPASTKK